MNEDILVSPEQLSIVRNELRVRLLQLTPNATLESGPVGEAREWYLLFKHWPDLPLGTSIGRERAFYNEYFWLKRFATLKQEQDGFDAGLEQQLFQLLEQAELDLDWQLIEQIDAKATDTHI